MTAEFIAFAKTGKLLEIQLGSPTGDIDNLLGPTMQLHRSDVTKEHVLKYGALQLTVVAGCIVMIAVSCLSESMPEPLQAFTILNPNISIYELLDMLDDNHVGWSVESRESFDRQLVLRTEAGVRLYFDLDHRQLQRFAIREGG